METTNKNNNNIFEYLYIILDRKWWVVLAAISGLLISAVISYVLPNVYQSSTLILVEPQKVPQEYVKSAVSGGVEERLSTIQQQIMSRSLLSKIIKEFGLEKGEQSLDDVIDKLRKKINIKIELAAGKNQAVNAFTISFEGNKPDKVMMITNKLASLFIEENLKIREQLVEGASDFLENELNRIKDKLEVQEKMLSDFKQKNMGELPSQMDANLRSLDRFQLEFESNSKTIKNLEDRKELLERSLTMYNDSSLISTGINPVNGQVVINPLRTKLLELQNRLMFLKNEYKENYPDIILIKKEIKDVEDKLSSENNNTENDDSDKNNKETNNVNTTKIDNNLSTILINKDLEKIKLEMNTINSRQTDLKKIINDYQKRVENIPKKEQEISILLRDYENTQKNYQSLLDKSLNANISQNMEKRQKGEQFRIIDEANLPVKPIRPKRIMIVLSGLLAGLCGGIGIAILPEILFPVFKKPEEIEEVIGIPVIGIIPIIDLSKEQ